jgi:hypothetical protein
MGHPAARNVDHAPSKVAQPRVDPHHAHVTCPVLFSGHYNETGTSAKRNARARECRSAETTRRMSCATFAAMRNRLVCLGMHKPGLSVSSHAEIARRA